MMGGASDVGSGSGGDWNEDADMCVRVLYEVQGDARGKNASKLGGYTKRGAWESYRRSLVDRRLVRVRLGIQFGIRGGGGATGSPAAATEEQRSGGGEGQQQRGGLGGGGHIAVAHLQAGAVV